MVLRVPTELKEDKVKEFQQLLKETHGKDISYDEAHELALSLIRFVALIISCNQKTDNNKDYTL